MSYYWYGGEKYVRQRVRECIACSHKNNVFNSADVTPLRPIPVTPKIFWRVHIDLAGPFLKTKNKNKYIAIGICAFTKYIEAKGNVLIFFFFLLILVPENVKFKSPVTVLQEIHMKIGIFEFYVFWG